MDAKNQKLDNLEDLKYLHNINYKQKYFDSKIRSCETPINYSGISYSNSTGLKNTY